MARLMTPEEVGALFSSLVEAGLYTIAKNPWQTGRLAEIVKAGLVKPDVSRYPKLVRKTPPWAKARQYMKGASAEQLRRWIAMAEASSATAGMPLAERIPAIRAKLATGRRATRKRKGTAIVPVLEAEIASRARASARQVAVATAGAPFTP